MQATRVSGSRSNIHSPVHGNRADGSQPRRRTLAVAITLAITAAAVGTVATPALAQTTRQPMQVASNGGGMAREYVIPAGPLDSTLATFSAQAGVHVDYSTELVAGKTSQGVSGRLAPSAALHEILRGTGIASHSVNPTTFVLRDAQQTNAGDPPQATTPPKSNPQKLQAIEVTGTHIRAAQLQTANPVVTVSAEQIQATGDLTVGDVIKNLPSVTGDVVTSNIDNGGGRGQTAVGLRGLGPARTLVLLNGQRIINDDLNVIPAAAIQRVEVMTTGASSVYGSDAIGGVINIILKQNYQGAQVQLNDGISSHGDGQRHGFSFMFGQTSDKGSIVAGIDYNKTEAIAQTSRPFSSQTLSYAGSTNTPVHTILGGSAFTPGSETTVPPALRAQFGGCTRVTLNPSSSGKSGRLGLGDFHCTVPTDQFSYSPYRPLTQPQERTDMFVNGTYHLSPNVDAFMTVLHNKTDSSFTLGPPVWGTAVGVDLSADSYYNPFGVEFSGTSGNTLNSRLTTIGNRVTPITRSQDDVMMGLRGFVTVLGHDWQWDIGFDYGHISSINKPEGLPVLSKLNPGLGPSMLDPATGQVVCVGTPGDLSTIISGCTPWDTFNLNNPASLAVVQAAGTTAEGITNTLSQERIKYADINGGIVDLPAGTMSFAFGGSYRTEYLNSEVGSALLADDFGGCPLSSQCTSPVRGGYSVKEVYGELFIPILKDIPGIQSLSVDLNDRYSKYSDFGSTSNWHIGVQYHPIQDVLLRGNVSEVFRAPTIGNIFAGLGIGGTTLAGDPCDHITSPNPACVGVPTDGSFVDQAVASHAQTNTLGSGSALAGFPLGPEEGKSFDFGAVWSPSFVPGRLSVSADAWRIYLNNNITGVSANTVLTACFNGLTQFCPLIDRFGTDTLNPGQIREIRAPTVNLGRIDVKGVDFNVAYLLPRFSFGQFDVTFNSTYMTQYKQQTAPGLTGNQEFNLVGNINTDVGGGIGILIPRFRAQSSVSWRLGNWSASWRMRFIDHFDLGSHVVARHYSAVPGFAKGNPYVLHYGSFTYNDLSVGYNIPAINTLINFGINNAFNKQPPFLPYNATGLGNGGSDGSDFDLIGRYYWARLTVNFK